MPTLQILFWLALGVVIYTYAGYGLLMGLWAQLRPRPRRELPTEYTPPVTLVIPAYNEAAVVAQKLANCRALDYPPAQLHLLFVTDGSTDGTPALIQSSSLPGEQVTLLHNTTRQGKPAAMNHAMQHVQTPLTLFTDANTTLNPQAIRLLVRHFAQPANGMTVGCVAGEKRVQTASSTGASGAGESLYWRYESTVKRWEAHIGHVMGAAGELFAIRTSCYTPLPANALLDDFVLSFRIAMQGYRLVYEPDAYALEHASPSIAEEWKRKIRISAGGIQSVLWLTPLLNPLRYGLLSLQYISHRVLRWTLTPLLLLLLLPLNLWLAWVQGGIDTLLCLGQLLFYGAAWAGWWLEARQMRWKPLFVPFYFTMMNLAVFAGLARYLAGRQDILWDKARRAGIY